MKRRNERRVSMWVTCCATVVALSACGSDDGAATPDPADTEAHVAETNEPAATEPAATEPASTEPSSTDASTTEAPDSVPSTDADGACRDIVHLYGTTCVPSDPQRIVALDSLMALPTLVEVGAPVVGAVSVYEVGDPFTSYLDPADVADIDVVGSLQAPNLEAIAALEPDLIIGSDLVVEPIYDQLQELAPTVVTPYSFYSSTWLDDAALVADAAGRSAEFAGVVADYDAHAAEVASTLADRGAPVTLSRVDMFAGMPLYYRFGCVWFGTVMAAVDVVQPEAQNPDSCADGDYESVIVYPSLETLDVLDADAIVAYQQQASAGDVGSNPLEALEVSPVWLALPAVKDGRVHVVGDAWGLGVSITAANQILDDLVNVVFPA